MKPFVLLSIRAEDAAAVDEYESFRRFMRVEQSELARIQLGQPDFALDLDDWSGVLLGGGAFTVSDPPTQKTSAQLRAEEDIAALLDRVVSSDFPFLGACYGIGTLGTHQGGVVDKAYPEPVGPISVTLTDAGMGDPLLAGLPASFQAYGGHKEALTTAPEHFAILASSSACPVQAFRVGANVYATQFHPELDLAGLVTRIRVYSTFGYFDPSDADRLVEEATQVTVSAPMRILSNFVRLHRR